MRVSADPKSPYYSSPAQHATVYLNGVELNYCIAADDVAGIVVCYAQDAAGYILHDGDNAKLVTRHGSVSIFIEGMDFDAWMRERTERAHAEFMARTRGMVWVDRRKALIDLIYKNVVRPYVLGIAEALGSFNGAAASALAGTWVSYSGLAATVPPGKP
jgi:hypothetical protein